MAKDFLESWLLQWPDARVSAGAPMDGVFPLDTVKHALFRHEVSRFFRYIYDYIYIYIHIIHTYIRIQKVVLD